MEKHRTDVQLRFADTDALGHVNNASFATFAEIARLDFLQRLGGSVRSLILASIHLDFRKQVMLGDKVHVETWIERMGSSSVTLAQHVCANGEKAADVKSVVVYFDYANQRSRPLTSEMRAALEPYLSNEAERT